MTRIAVIGTGYVGLVSGACLSDFGNTVICVDTDTRKIDRLNAGEMTIFEPGLDDVVARNRSAGRLVFSIDVADSIRASEAVFIAVGTPPANDGSANMRYVEAAAHEIGRHLDGYKVIVDKSTVPIGTGRAVRTIVRAEVDRRGRTDDFDVVSNPEFLREGSAVYDFMHPDRVVLGVESHKAAEVMKAIYRVLYLRETPFIETTIESAEMIKYASNSFLALKIAFANEIANLCEGVGANVIDVMKALGRDGRIGPKFLHPGPGYGGSCLPKDTKALADTARKTGIPLTIVDAVIAANERQKTRMISKIERALGGLDGKRVAVLGLAFKPNTDDVRDAPSITIVRELVARGARVQAFDPVAMAEARSFFADIEDWVSYGAEEYETMKGADALVILTEWNQFRNLDLAKAKLLLKQPILLDLRNIYDRTLVESSGFTYFGVGR